MTDLQKLGVWGVVWDRVVNLVAGELVQGGLSQRRVEEVQHSICGHHEASCQMLPAGVDTVLVPCPGVKAEEEQHKEEQYAEGDGKLDQGGED